VLLPSAKTCPACAADNPPRARFCLACGVEFRPKCPRCAVEVESGWRFCVECGCALNDDRSQDRQQEKSAPRIDEPRLASGWQSTIAGERKPVTVVFADIKGSTGLIENLDPDDARLLFEAVLNVMRDAVHLFGGVVSKMMGDGMMALFGAPVALEDHAVRACRAALAMRRAVLERCPEIFASHGVKPEVRIGMNSGEVVVLGVASELRLDFDAVGATVHLAARMEHAADSDTIWMTGHTARLVTEAMRLRPLGPVVVAGFSKAVPAFELLGPIDAFGASQTCESGHPMRGRIAERQFLSNVTERVERGRSETVMVLGEVGFGKSRFCSAVAADLTAQGWLCLRTGAAPSDGGEPWRAMRSLLSPYFMSDEEPASLDLVTRRLMRLNARLGSAAPAIAELLGIEMNELTWADSKPTVRRLAIIDACQEWLIAESPMAPVAVFVDDWQWVDLESAALLRAVSAQLGSAPVLLIVAGRSERDQEPPLAATHLRLLPLEPVDASTLLDDLTEHDPKLKALAGEIVARASGNPLFLTEIIKALAADAAFPDSIPLTVQSIVTARIDALGESEKAVLRAASIVGRQFSISEISHILGQNKSSVREFLRELERKGLVEKGGGQAEPMHRFVHVITLEVVYRSLLTELRRELHKLAFAAIERESQNERSPPVSRLAHHAFRAALWEEATRYGAMAARRASARSAYEEAASLYRDVLSALANFPESRERQSKIFDAKIELRHALFPCGRFDEIGQLLDEAHAIAESLGDDERHASVLVHQTTHHLGAGRHRLAARTGSRALALVDGRGRDAQEREVLFNLTQAFAACGDYAQSAEAGNRLIAMSGDGVASIATTALARMWVAWCLAELGAFGEAEMHVAAAYSAARGSGEELPLLLARLTDGLVALRAERFRDAASSLEAAFVMSEDATMMAWRGAVASPLGRCWIELDRVEDAVELLEGVAGSGLAARGHVLRKVHLGEAYLAAGRAVDAVRLAREGIETAELREERGNQAYALLLCAETVVVCGEWQNALDLAGRAEQIASESAMIPLMRRIARFKASRISPASHI